MSLNFLLQATRVLHVSNYDEDELEMIYNFFIAVDNEILNDYYNRCTILSYNNDLELYIAETSVARENQLFKTFNQVLNLEWQFDYNFKSKRATPSPIKFQTIYEDIDQDEDNFLVIQELNWTFPDVSKYALCATISTTT